MFFRIASQMELAERERLSLEFLSLPEEAGTKPVWAPERESIPDELLAYLMHIVETPDLSVSERYERFRIHKTRGAAMTKRLLELGLVEIRKESSGSGRPSAMLVITPKGLESTRK